MDRGPLSTRNEISYWELKKENGRPVFLIDNGEKNAKTGEVIE